MNELLKDALYTKKPLKFGENGKFKILMISDIHGGKGYAADLTVRDIDAIVETEKPDLVIMGGDIAGPGYIHVETEEDLRNLLDGVASPMEKRNIPWAHVYGNHDDNFGLENAVQQKIYETYPNCVSKAGPKDIDGVGNYFLPIYDNKGEKILFGVWGLDSHRGTERYGEYFGTAEKYQYFHAGANTSGSYDGAHFDQVMWYYNTSKEIEKYNGAKVPSLMYMHIPTPEHALVTTHKNRTNFSGYHLEDVACNIVNFGLFGACLQRNDVKAIFCGHEHENNFCGTYCGIKLGYDGHMSYHACHNDEVRGGRVFEIDANNPAEINTYLVKSKDAVKKLENK
ncbi:MAG: hypothetical protein E7564_11375 [Ruminococcaceae bacterium]|nr:hypothetical protein [Oscillospiraceae bacterium]